MHPSSQDIALFINELIIVYIIYGPERPFHRIVFFNIPGSSWKIHVQKMLGSLIVKNMENGLSNLNMISVGLL